MKLLGYEITREKRAELTIESPGLSFVDWLDGMGGKSKADIAVTEDSALTLSAFYGCVKIISETIAELPIDLYKRTADGKEQVNDDISYLIGTEPNQYYSSYTFRQALQACALIHGNGYAYIERPKTSMKVRSLTLLDPMKVEVRVVAESKEVVYIIGGTQIVEPWQIIHIKGMTLNGITGLSPLKYHQESIASGLAMQEFGNKFFAKGTLATGIVTRPTEITQKGIDAIRKQWDKNYAGRANQHKVMVLDAGMDFKQLSINPEQAQFLQSRNYNVEEVARVFRVPQHMLQKLDRSTNNNIEQQSLEFLQYCMLPHIKNWEQELDRKLLKAKDHFFKFNINALMRGDAKSRAEYYVKAIQNGWLTRNEVRMLENMNRLDGLDQPLTPMNLTTNPDDNEQDRETDI
jgi:HK97 family phage portal protein